MRTAFLLLALQAGPPEPPRFPFDPEAARRYREDYAQARGLAAAAENSLGMKLALIPPGRFEMGPRGSTYRVTLARPYYLGVSEVTLAQFRAWRPGHRIEGSEEAFQEGDRPAAQVSWLEAREFCAWLSERPEEKAAGRAYDLPTEAQWEWAARAGSGEDHPFDDPKRLVEHAWFNHTYTPNPKHEAGERGRRPVMKLKANAWGLHDLLGNVWEWCLDRREDPATGERRDPALRGGGWRSGGFHCTVVAHDPGDPRLRADHVGFRVACTAADPSKR
jgi:formylglycine-generating enzyme required for sulfatase activity